MALLLLAGCAHHEAADEEVKQIDQKVTDAELERFLAVVDSLPGKKLPEFRPVYATPPEWSSSRTRPVGELVKEELRSIDERWEYKMIVEQLRLNKRLQRVLRREQMSPEQFVGLSLSLGVALGRLTIREDQDLERLVKTGRRTIEQLEAEVELFSSLSPQQQHAVLQRAVWITRADRAKRLLMVPPENVAIVRENRERLEQVFPAAYTSNPLDPVADLLAERGVPFVETPSSGTDDAIEWKYDEAVVGSDDTAFGFGDEVEDEPGRR